MKTILSSLRLLRPFYLALGLLCAMELALEFRHYTRGFDTPVFGALATRSVAQDEPALALYGATPEYPFRSLLPEHRPSDSYALWIASASHAEHSRLPPESIFPNLICDEVGLRSPPCFVINGSAAGRTIDENAEQIAQWAHRLQPDAILLYQMAIFLADYQRQSSRDTIEGGAAPKAGAGEVDIQSDWKLSQFIQRTSIFSHLDSYLTSTLKLSATRDETVDGVERAWHQALKNFETFCRSNDYPLILATFAIAHDVSNVDEATHEFKTTLVRQNPTLSVAGYVKIVSDLNEITRAYGVEHDIPLIDLATSVGGKSEYFIDFVHFSRSGHRKVAETIAGHMNGKDLVGRKGAPR